MVHPRKGSNDPNSSEYGNCRHTANAEEGKGGMCCHHRFVCVYAVSSLLPFLYGNWLSMAAKCSVGGDCAIHPSGRRLIHLARQPPSKSIRSLACVICVHFTMLCCCWLDVIYSFLPFPLPLPNRRHRQVNHHYHRHYLLPLAWIAHLIHGFPTWNVFFVCNWVNAHAAKWILGTWQSTDRKSSMPNSGGGTLSDE